MTESPKYIVSKKQKNMEIRSYRGYIQAEVQVNGSGYRSVIEKGFRVLAGYIFGNNISRQSIEMTTPVQVSRSQKIAMTTPVTVSGKDSYKVAFIMPSEYTLDTLPIPGDKSIRITSIPEHQMAAIRFSGYFNQDQINENKQLLGQWLDDQGLETIGDYIVAGYNPPWVPGFFARNEALIRIKN